MLKFYPWSLSQDKYKYAKNHSGDEPYRNKTASAYRPYTLVCNYTDFAETLMNIQRNRPISAT